MRVSPGQESAFFADVNAAAKQATWCALATVADGEPRVRMVHPTWEGDVLWLATDPGTPKSRQIAAQPVVDVQFQVAPPNFTHLLVRGRASLHDDAATRQHCWDVLDYDLFQFWPDGPASAGFVAVKIIPDRVELSDMFGTANKRVWLRGA